MCLFKRGCLIEGGATEFQLIGILFWLNVYPCKHKHMELEITGSDLR